MSKDDDEIKKKLRELEAKTNARHDQRFSEVRSEYEGLDPAERKALRKWVEKLAELSAPDLSTALAMPRIEFIVQGGNPEEPASYGVTVSVPSLLRAIEAWDKGKDFVPKWSET